MRPGVMRMILALVWVQSVRNPGLAASEGRRGNAEALMAIAISAQALRSPP